MVPTGMHSSPPRVGGAACPTSNRGSVEHSTRRGHAPWRCITGSRPSGCAPGIDQNPATCRLSRVQSLRAPWHGPPNRMKRVARPGIRRCPNCSRPADRTRGWFHSVWRPMQAPVPKGAGGARGAENDKISAPVPGRCSQEQTCSRGLGGHQAPTYTHHKRRTRPHMHRVNRSRARWPRLDMLSWQLCGAKMSARRRRTLELDIFGSTFK